MMTTDDLVRAARAEVRELTPAEARPALGRMRLVDVREPEEFRAGALPGAVNVPRGLLEFRLGLVPALADREAEILLYCGSGGRSALAAQTLQRLGYVRVSSLAGGYAAWQAEGGETVSPG